MDWFNELAQLGTVSLAALLGGIVGLERELSRKAAGLRTHVFVSSGSALLVLLSDSITSEFSLTSAEQVSADPIRIVQAIVVGISFLGAGTIVHGQGREIEGLTTAGSIYMTAGVGIAVAVDQFVLALGTALLSIAVLQLIGRIECQIAKGRKGPVEDQPTDGELPVSSPSSADTAERGAQ